MLRTKGQSEAIVKSLKRFPEFVPKIYDELNSCFSEKGVDLDSLLEQNDEGGQVEACVAEGMGLGQLLAVADAPNNVSGVAHAPFNSAAAASVDPHGSANGLRTLGALTTAGLITVLTSCEPVLFSRAALTALQAKGARAPPKAVLLEIIEFISNMKSDGLVESALEVVQQRAAQLNAHYGRRGLELMLPPCWRTAGVYEKVSEAAGVLKIMHRFNKLVRVVPAGVLQGVSVECVYIWNNFSEDRACLASVGTALNFPINVLFSAARLDAAQSNITKRARLLLAAFCLGLVAFLLGLSLASGSSGAASNVHAPRMLALDFHVAEEVPTAANYSSVVAPANACAEMSGSVDANGAISPPPAE